MKPPNQITAKKSLKGSKRISGQDKKTLPTKERVLIVACSLLQKYGYGGFSFQHIADAIGLRKPSLYDHFSSKEMLGEILIEAYHNDFKNWVQMTKVFQPQDKVIALFELFYEFAKDESKFCPLTALTAEANSLPKGIKERLRKMHQFQKNWLVEVIHAGKKQKVFRSESSAKVLAESLMALAYGAQLSARLLKDPACLRRERQQALRILQTK